MNEDITNEIIEKIKRLEITTDLKQIKEIVSYIEKFNVDVINGHEAEMAVLFCACLEAITKTDTMNENMGNLVKAAFRNISNMKVDSEQTSSIKKTLSAVKTWELLKKINKPDDQDQETYEITEYQREEFTSLLDMMESIKLVFKIEKSDGTRYFPIDRLLYNIIDCKDVSDLDSKTIQAMMLALQLFDKAEIANSSESAKWIIEQSGLKFVDYLASPTVTRIGDDDWKKNFEENGLLVLLDSAKSSVLIRNVERDYFEQPGIDTDLYGIGDIKSEKNKNEEEIAFYIEYNYAGFDNFRLVNIHKEFNKDDNGDAVCQILDLIYEKGYYNVFSNNSLILNGDKILPINPYGNNDRYVVDGEIFSAKKNEYVSKKFKEYGLLKLYGQGLDYINLGNIVAIEEINPVSTVKLDISKTSYDFNEILLNWVENCDDKKKAFNSFFRDYSQKLSFINTSESYLDKEFSAKDDYYVPRRLSVDILEHLDFDDRLTSDAIKKCKAEYDSFDDKYVITFDGALLEDDYSLEELNGDGSFWEHNYGSEVDAIIDRDEKKVYAGDDIKHYQRLKDAIEDLNRHMLEDDARNIIDEIVIQNLIHKYVGLFRKSYKEMHKVIPMDSAFRYRLINHFSIYRWNGEKIQKWLRLINKHQAINYAVLKTSDFFGDDADKKNGILYVPKNRSNTESTLKMAANEYLFSYITRIETDFYDQSITRDEEGDYCVNGKRIEEICFIFDIIQCGSATIDTLSYYLKEYKGDEKILEHNQYCSYPCNGEFVPVLEIIQKNKCKVRIFNIYSGLEGRERVREYLNREHPEIDCTICVPKKELNVIATSDDVNDAYDLYGKKQTMKEGNYMVVREFNQPKSNVMPNDWLNFKKVGAIFTKRKEIFNKRM